MPQQRNPDQPTDTEADAKGGENAGRAAGEGSAASGAFSDALSSLLRIAARRGREELGRAAAVGKVRLELRQLRRDRSRMYEKLGREVILLVDGGEIDHPGLVKGVARIRELEGRIASVEANLRASGASEADLAADDGEKDLAAGGEGE